MIYIGIVVAIFLGILLSIFIAPYGGIVLIAIIFGVVLSTHVRTIQLQNDLQAIKEKLGIKDIDEGSMTNEEIEKELEDELLNNH